MATAESRSIQSEQPLKPKCPMACREKCLPEEEFSEGVSQPIARSLPSGGCRCANSSIVAGSNSFGLSAADPPTIPPSRVAAANRSRYGTFEKRPACPAAPRSTHAFSSCTSPWIWRWRKVESASVGGIKGCSACRGQNPVAVIARGPKTSRRSQGARRSRTRTSSALPSKMKPGSEYSTLAPGSACKGRRRQARKRAGGVVASRKNSTSPGNPELCASKWCKVTRLDESPGARPTTKSRKQLTSAVFPNRKAPCAGAEAWSWQWSLRPSSGWLHRKRSRPSPQTQRPRR